jgi:predicted metalloprotease
MPWEIDWAFAARAQLLEIPWHDAERVDAAVLRFAERGEGDRRHIRGDPFGLWLRVAGYVVRLELDPGRRLIRVLHFFRAASA